eukprot:TRINITY_DN2993_c0_g1_i1.p1 TRINITY_DN2993_c0_g1~~TRINITY_DN2993_c0_g1_i1.p1  ORF type:complete len:210 (-),score=46.10 TRINITY_DN2993_c0_g1_i1:91-720(-)
MSGFKCLLGVTGGIASGKSNIMRILKGLGAKCVNNDLIGHKIYEPGTECFNKVVEEFGGNIVGSDKKIDRKILGDIVFSDQARLDALKSIVWPEIKKESIKELYSGKAESHEVGVLEGFGLIEAGRANEFDEIWVTHVQREVAIQRIIERNGLTQNEAEQRYDSQSDPETRFEYASMLIDTDRPKEETEQLVLDEWRKLCSKYGLSTTC